MPETEIEVKILGHSVEEYIKMMDDLGAIFVGKETQINHRFLNANVSGDSYLRLREVGDKATFTLKERTDDKTARINREFSTDVCDAQMFLTIMKKVGFDYSSELKERIKYKYKDFIFDIDKWDDGVYPFPYMEIEATSTEDLEQIIFLLNIDKKDVSTKSIKELIYDYNCSK